VKPGGKSGKQPAVAVNLKPVRPVDFAMDSECWKKPGKIPLMKSHSNSQPGKGLPLGKPMQSLSWLVVSTCPSGKYEFVSWRYDIPNEWKVIKFMFQSTNQLRQCESCHFPNPEPVSALDPTPCRLGVGIGHCGHASGGIVDYVQ
jgi:hypothetical protein